MKTREEIQAKIEELEKAIERKDYALNKIIEMNRQTALDKYGDAEKAESWACVSFARSALD